MASSSSLSPPPMDREEWARLVAFDREVRKCTPGNVGIIDVETIMRLQRMHLDPLSRPAYDPRFAEEPTTEKPPKKTFTVTAAASAAAAANAPWVESNPSPSSDSHSGTK